VVGFAICVQPRWNKRWWVQGVRVRVGANWTGRLHQSLGPGVRDKAPGQRIIEKVDDELSAVATTYPRYALTGFYFSGRRHHHQLNSYSRRNPPRRLVRLLPTPSENAASIHFDSLLPRNPGINQNLLFRSYAFRAGR